MAGRVAPKAGSRKPVAEYDATVAPTRPLPHPGRGRAWDRRARDAWRALTSEPWTADWSGSDHALAVRWLHLQQAFWEAYDAGATPSSLKSLNAELRAMEQSLFASPASRQQNRILPARPRPARRQRVDGEQMSEREWAELKQRMEERRERGAG